MNLFKTSFWSGISTVFKILASMVTTKIIAIFIGPQGVALLGNFNNITNMLTPFANGGTSNGIIKYLAEHCENNNLQKKIVSQAIKINLICSFFISLIILIFYKQVTYIAIKNIDYSPVIITLGLTIVFYGFNLTISSILNGYRKIKYLIITNILASIISVILAVIVTMKYGLFGALLNPIIAQVIIFSINIIFIIKLKLFSLSVFRESFNKEISFKLLKFGLMNLTTAIFIPLTTFILRNYIFNNFSSNEAGFVQGVWSISNSYLSIITTTLAVYYLPTLAAIKDKVKLRKEIIKGYKFLLPLAILGGGVIFIFRDLIIQVLYTKEFAPMKEYFTMQIIGDTFKIAAFLLAHLLIAKGMTRWFIISEVVFSITNLTFSILLMNRFGSIGITYAYALNYLLYLLFLLWLFKDIIFMRQKEVNDVL